MTLRVDPHTKLLGLNTAFEAIGQTTTRFELLFLLFVFAVSLPTRFALMLSKQAWHYSYERGTIQTSLVLLWRAWHYFDDLGTIVTSSVFSCSRVCYFMLGTWKSAETSCDRARFSRLEI
jgi:hypothetical protein